MLYTAKEQTAKKQLLTTRELTLTALMTAITCIMGPISCPLPFTPVSISLGTLAIYLSAYVLGMKYSVLSCAAYILLGSIGLPVFTEFSAGIDKVLGPTGGYMAGYFFIAAIGGFFAEHFNGKRIFAVIGMVLGTACCYLLGSLWLARCLEMDFLPALAIGVLPYLPGDAAKIAVAAILGGEVRLRLQKVQSGN